MSKNERLVARATVAAITRGIRAGERSPDDPKLAEAHRTLKRCRIDALIDRVTDAWPDVTENQKQRVAALLTTGANNGTA